MNTANIKKYAPLARNAFITAVTIRANELGIYDSHIEEAITEGQVLKIEGRSVDLKLKGARNKLIKRVASMGFKPLMEHVAYTWFNRLCAIRYMELHDYLGHGLRVLSHPENNSGFEILEHAQDVAEGLGLNRDQIIELKLAGNQDELLYRTLLLGQCHALHKAMPFLFEAIDDETELLLPDNLTRTDSILRGLVNDIPAEDWEHIEVIGWLYQFYISEKKDQVIGKVVKREDIPAATQLFTPNWIVKYMVQNSLGRHWLNHYPESPLKNDMDYYVDSAAENASIVINSESDEAINPEHITLIDPACGSGHILVEAYDLLKAIYEERGYRLRDIPKLILENNLYGLDIDDRAAQLSGFALMMKARADDRRIFTRGVQLNILSLQSSKGLDAEQLVLNAQHLWQAHYNAEEIDSLQSIIAELISTFEQADCLGSLIQISDSLSESLPVLERALNTLADNIQDYLAQQSYHCLMPLLKQALILAQRYDAVVANPPYMGGKGMNPELKAFAKKYFPDSKSDLFAISVERFIKLSKDKGQLGFVTPFTWMFIKSYENFRTLILRSHTLQSLIQPEYHAFFDSAYVPLCTFTLATEHIEGFIGSFIKLSDFYGADNQAPKTLEAINNPDCGWFHRAKPDDFKKIPGSPIAYWVSSQVIKCFENNLPISSYFFSEGPCKSGNDDKYLRLFWEVNAVKIEKNYSWRFCSKGGGYRKYFGNIEHVLKWTNESQEHYRKDNIARITPKETQNREGVTWSILSSKMEKSFRFLPEEALFNSVSPAIFPKNKEVSNIELLVFLNSKIASYFANILNQTLALNVANVITLPWIVPCKRNRDLFSVFIDISKLDWNTYETSWDFQNNPLIVAQISNSVTQQIEAENVGLRDKAANPTYALSDIYTAWQSYNHATIAEMQRLEQENNRLFIDAYGLQDELTPDIPLEQITLTVNPKYRYGGKLSDETLDNRFQSDTLAELISYAIGCMMGRYSLDKAGLVYAHSGNVDFDTIYHADSEQSNYVNTFAPDNDGILPLTDQEWFKEDIIQRLQEFIRVAFADPENPNRNHLQANLDFIAQSLCLYALKPKKGEISTETLRRYLCSQFYKDHLKTYKKRPIYWLFSSGKNKAFECLVYLHRYNESTLARMRTEYVTPLLGKYTAHAEQLQKQMDDASSTAEANRYKKSLTALEKKQTELSDFDDKLKHHADMRISIDLDDGVKVNYGKFGDLLAEVRAVTGKK